MALGIAFAANPFIKASLLQLAELDKEDRQRAQEILAFDARRMPAINAGHPHTGDELREFLSKLLRDLWPHVHESCINGAMIMGVMETPSGWRLNAFAMVKCMRETADADRSMRLGHGR